MINETFIFSRKSDNILKFHDKKKFAYTSEKEIRMYWVPPDELNAIEQMIVKRTKKARKLFVFFREHRNNIISEEFEQKLIDTYQNGGKEPALPGQLAMAILLQTYCKVSDKEAVELTVMDKRWQMVLRRHYSFCRKNCTKIDRSGVF